MKKEFITDLFRISQVDRLSAWSVYLHTKRPMTIQAYKMHGTFILLKSNADSTTFTLTFHVIKKTKMTKILISLFLLFNFGTISGQEFENLIRTEGGKTLYIYTENKFEIDESKFGNDKINIETNSGEIKRFFKGNYMIKPNRIGICTISIYNEDKSKKIFSEEFRVIFSEKPEIMPVFYSQKNGIRDNEIPKERLEDFAGFGMMISTQNEIIYLIEEMDLIIYSRKNGEFKFQTTGKFSAEIKEKINALNEGDLILLKNISVKSVTDYSKKDNPDQIINILPTVFFVK